MTDEIDYTVVGDFIVLRPNASADYANGVNVEHVRAMATTRAKNTGKDIYVFATPASGSGQNIPLFAVSPTGVFTST